MENLNLNFGNTTRLLKIAIPLNISNDTLVEGHEIINISLTDPVISGLDNSEGAVLSSTMHRTLVIIEDDDGKYNAQCHLTCCYLYNIYI